jgi:hypothetical protein
MQPREMNEYIKPLKKNWKIITMEDPKYGIEENWCSHYLWKQKVLLMESIINKKILFKDKTLMRGYDLAENKLQSKYISLTKFVFCINGTKSFTNIYKLF